MYDEIFSTFGGINENHNNNNNKHTSQRPTERTTGHIVGEIHIIREMGNDPLILSRMNAEMFNGHDDDDDDDALN